MAIAARRGRRPARIPAVFRPSRANRVLLTFRNHHPGTAWESRCLMRSLQGLFGSSGFIRSRSGWVLLVFLALAVLISAGVASYFYTTSLRTFLAQKADENWPDGFFVPAS